MQCLVISTTIKPLLITSNHARGTHVWKFDHKIKIYLDKSCNIENKISSVKKVNLSYDNSTNAHVSQIE
jgi:hypothetical protein